MQDINPKEYEGSVVFLYGDECAERNLPLAKKEVERIKNEELRNKNFVVGFDRLPHRLFLVKFDSECPAPEVQEELRRLAVDVLKMMEKDGVKTVALCGEGTLPEEVAAFVEGLTLADYSFDRFCSKERFHVDQLIINSVYFKQEELDAQQRLWNRIFWCREWVNLPVADLNAAQFAEELQSVAEGFKNVKCTVMDKRKIESLRMGGLLAVNRGSVDEPRFVVLEYTPNNSSNQNNPLILVTDEPTGNLDPMISQEIMQLFLKINARGTTVIMATHNHNLVNKLRKRVLALVEGQIVKDEECGTYAYE